ncbi:MAG: hypothetical protein GX660_14120 [Clostridiaceae bacterium]|nr:hypothetical protein [Clostridiaceae bacterium]
MDGRLTRSILTILVAVFLFFIGIGILKWAFSKVLPVVLVIGVIYVVYRLATGKKIF